MYHLIFCRFRLRFKLEHSVSIPLGFSQSDGTRLFFMILMTCPLARFLFGLVGTFDKNFKFYFGVPITREIVPLSTPKSKEVNCKNAFFVR